ncbi:MAG TPA: tetratricopeptide repeat protein [Terriglobia bacterium]|nr:tetratricopeptide repeat protein [Terriglobia bacterium]
MRLRNLSVLFSSALFAFTAVGYASPSRWEKAIEAERTSYQQCRFDRAEKFLKIATKEALHFNFDDPRLAETLNAGGNLFRAEGQFRRAEFAYDQALIWGGAWLKPDSPVLARSLVGLGIISQETHQNGFERAESFFNEALKIQNISLGPDNLEVATTLNCLGELNLLWHRDGIADSLFQRALAIRRKNLNSDDPALAQTLEDLGLVCAHEGRLNQAASSFQEALTIYRESLGPNHCGLAVALRNYASLLAQMGRAAEAKKLEAESLAIALQHLPKGPVALPFDHPRLVRHRN